MLYLIAQLGTGLSTINLVPRVRFSFGQHQEADSGDEIDPRLMLITAMISILTWFSPQSKYTWLSYINFRQEFGVLSSISIVKVSFHREGLSFSNWDKWVVQGSQEFKLKDFIRFFKVIVVYSRLYWKRCYIMVTPRNWRNAKLAHTFCLLCLISMTCLVKHVSNWKNCGCKRRLIRIIFTKTREYYIGSHFCIRSMKWRDLFFRCWLGYSRKKS